MCHDLCDLIRIRRPLDRCFVMKSGSKALRLPVKPWVLTLKQEAVPAPTIDRVFVDATSTHVIVPDALYLRFVPLGFKGS